jgi:methyl-accepting chemotaxis protein
MNTIKSFLNYFSKKISIRNRLLTLLGIGIVVASLTGAINISQLFISKDAIQVQEEQLDRMEIVNSIMQNFSDLKYWYTELALSLSDESIEQAESAKKRLYLEINILEGFAPEIAENLRKNIQDIEDNALSALDSYFDEDRDTGNQLMDRARIAGENSTAILKKIFEKENHIVDESSAVVGHSINNVTKGAFVAVLLTFVTNIIILISIMFSVVKPIKRMTSSMTSLANDNLDVSIPALDYEDEVGEMAHAVEVFKKNGIRAKELSAEQEKEALQKEERSRVLEKSISTFEDAIGDILTGLNYTTTDLEKTSSVMVQSSQDVKTESQTATKSSEAASGNVETVAASVEQLSSSIQQINDQIQLVSNTVDTTSTTAEKTNTKVESLSEAAQRIGEIVNLINEIADQTNLLALNATIEAARAGDAGKGFAVVASEVKSLASETTNAVSDISSQIEQIQALVGDTVSAIQQISSKVYEIKDVTEAVEDAVNQQSLATSEIAKSAQEASQSTQHVETSSNRVYEISFESEKSSNKVKESVEELKEGSETLKTEVDKFLQSIV